MILEISPIKHLDREMVISPSLALTGDTDVEDKPRRGDELGGVFYEGRATRAKARRVESFFLEMQLREQPRAQMADKLGKTQFEFSAYIYDAVFRMKQLM